MARPRVPVVAPECSPAGTQGVLEAPGRRVDHVVEEACHGRAPPSAASFARTLAPPPGSMPGHYGAEPPQYRRLSLPHVEARGADGAVAAARAVCHVYSTTRQTPACWGKAVTRPLLPSRSAPSNSPVCCSGTGSVQEGVRNLRGPGRAGRLKPWGGE